MKARLLIGSVATVSALALFACKDQTPVFAGGTPGAPVTMTLSQTVFVLPDGGNGTLSAQLFDSAGNVAAGTVTIATCNSAVVTTTDSTPPAQWAAAATVTAAAPGTACITATSGTIVDTANVTVGPASLSISGPATVVSGAGAMVSPFVLLTRYVYKVTGYNKAGTALAANSFLHAWGSVDTTMLRPLSRSADSVLVEAPGHLGTTRIMVTAIGGATALLNVTVTPDLFTSTGATMTIPAAAALSRPAVDSIVLTRCAAVAGACTGINPALGTRAFVDGVETFLKALPAVPPNPLVTRAIIMPPILNTGVVTVLMGQMGALNTTTSGWQQGTVTAGASSNTVADAGDPLNDVAATAPLTVSAAAATFDLYGVVSGVCTDGVGAGGTDCVDWYAFQNNTAAAHGITINLTWFTAADLDVTLFDNTGAGTALSPNGSSVAPGGFGTVGESIAYVVPANATVRIRVRYHTANGAVSTLYKLQIVET